jgi:hypothetical protein
LATYAVGTRTVAATATLPCMSLYAIAAVSFDLLEVGITNTTVTANVVGLCRLTTAGTPGSGLTEAALDQGSVAASSTAFLAHTGTPPTLVDLGYRWSLGSAIGSGVIWTFGPGELHALIGTANGVGIWCPTGTGQALDVYMKWVE